MKKRLLFVMDSLGIGGGEKSLVTLLSLIDYSRYDVDLQLFSYGGDLQQFVPNEVNVLSTLPYNDFLNKGLTSAAFSFKIKKLWARLSYSAEIRKHKLTHAEKAMRFWQICSKCYKPTEQRYDVAIAYSQGVPTFYVVDKVNADKKIGWVNVDLPMKLKLKTYLKTYYTRLDNVVAVSEHTKLHMFNMLNLPLDKVTVIMDIIDHNLLDRMSKMPVDFPVKNENSIMTLARLNYQKGFDISLKAADILNKRGVNFDWHVFGNGPEKEKMIHFIVENGLETKFHIHKPVSNPYPYLSKASIYVQTSRNEGFGISIAEARILNIPVVCTEFSAVWSQMVQGKNGTVVPIDPVAVADAIEDLILHPEKRKAISDYQRTEKKGNTEEIEKFYALIEGDN